MRGDRRQGADLAEPPLEGDWPYVWLDATSIKVARAVASSPRPSPSRWASTPTEGVRCWAWTSAAPRRRSSGSNFSARRQARARRGGRLHRHRICPGRRSSSPCPVARGRRPTAPQAAKAGRLHGRGGSRRPGLHGLPSRTPVIRPEALYADRPDAVLILTKNLACARRAAQRSMPGRRTIIISALHRLPVVARCGRGLVQGVEAVANTFCATCQRPSTLRKQR